MASYEAQINLLVSGQQQLDRLSDRLRSIERQIIDINRLGVSPQQRDPVTGRFGADPDRANRIRLRRLQEIDQQEQRRASASRRLLQGQNTELLNSIRYHSQLNAAVDLYQRKLEELSRGGGGRRLTQDLRDQVDQIERAFDAATAGGTTNLRLVRSLATELGRVVERQNEINRLSTFQSKAFFQAQSFERRMAQLRAEGAGAGSFGGVGRQMRSYRSAISRGSEFEANDIARRIKEALNRIQRELDASAAEARALARAANENLRQQQEVRSAQRRLQAFFDDAANQALMIRQNARDTAENWRAFFEDASQEAVRLREQQIQGINNRLNRFKRLQGDPNAYSSEIGPLPTGRAGGPRYFQEARQIAKELLDVENEIGSIREQSLNKSLQLETDRLKLVEKRKQKESEIRDVLLDAISFGKSADVKRTARNIATGSRNALVRGGIGLGALGIGGIYEGVSNIGNIDLGLANTLKGPAATAASAIGESINEALGGIPAIVNSVLSALGDIPSALGLAAVAAYAFAPAMKTAGDAVFLAGKKFGESKFGQNIRLTLDRQTNLFESVINAATEMNMVLDASKSGLDAVGQKVESLPALPMAGQTSFRGKTRLVASRETLNAIEAAKARNEAYSGGITAISIGGGARQLKNAEFLATETGKIAARSQESAAASLLFAEGLGQAANEAKTIADYLKEASDLRIQTETKTQQFIRETVQKGRMAQRDQQTVDEMRRRSAMLQGEQYSLAQIPVRGELLPGGRTEARQSDYREMLNIQARIRQYAEDVLSVMSKQQGSTATLDQLQKKLLGNVSESIAAHGTVNTILQQQGVTQEKLLQLNRQSNEVDERSIQIIRERNRELRARPVASMTPQERVAAGILDPESLRQQRLFRIREGRTPDFMKGLTAPGGLLSGLPGTAGRKSKAVQEGLVGGAFPLLFGQGLGASAGGALGGVAGGLMGGGLGMGLSLLGTSVGGFLDQAVIKAQELGNLLTIAGNNGNDLRQQGIFYTAELEKQVMLLREQGQFTKAKEIQQGAISAQTGDIGTFNTKAATAAANELQKAWNGFSSTIGNLLATAATPFVFIISVILRTLQSALKVANQITSGISWLINNIPVIGPMVQKFSEYATEQAMKGTQEYENQLAELDKQIAANEKNNKILTDKNNIIQGALGKSKVQFDLASKEAEARQRAAELEREIQGYRREAPTGTAELRQKAAQKEAQMRFEFAEKERTILLTNAREVFTAITDSNRAIAGQQKQYQREYADMVRQNARSQQDLDLEVARKVQDIRLEMREKELQYAKQVSDQELAAAKLLNEQRSFQRGISAAISGNPQDDIINTVQTAIENWRTGRQEVEQEYAAKQKEIQLQAQKAEIAIQRYKYDNALKIARANEESQLKISKMQEQINIQNFEVARSQFEMQKNSLIAVQARLLAGDKIELLRAEKSQKVKDQSPEYYAYWKEEVDAVKEVVRIRQKALDDITNLFNDVTIKKLTPVGPAPKLTNPSAPASIAMKDAKKQTEEYGKQLAYLEKMLGLNEKDLALAKAMLDPSEQALRQFNETVNSQQRANIEREAYNKLIMDGTLPALAKEQRSIEQVRDAQLYSIDTLIDALTALPENQPGSTVANIIASLSGMRAKFVTQSDTAVMRLADSYSAPQRMTEEIVKLKEELITLIDPVSQITQAAASIGEAFSASFKGVIDGSMTAKESLANFFKSTASYFLDMAGQIISQMIQMAILNTVVGLLPGSAGASKGLNVAGINNYGSQAPILPYPNALGGMFMNGIQPFARGGIVTSPTLFKFANGGALRTGLMGEAGPEAVMPLKRGPGGRLGVDASGSGGGVSVTVNVDASGSNVSGDNRQAGELGRAISVAVQQELLKQKRPGGLLS